MKEIQLTQGFISCIDDEDYERVSKYKWCFTGRYAVNATQGALHRFIMRCPDGKQVDHINGKPLDNRRCNLRVVSVSDNRRNRGKNKSKALPKGVRFDKRSGQYQATFRSSHDTIEEAADAYNKAARAVFGKYARVNEI